MSLKEEIQSLQDQMLPQIPEPALQAMAAATEKLMQSGIAERAIKAGEPAPGFRLEDTSGEVISLSGLLDKGPVVLNFFRGAWCPYCNLELKALDRIMPQVRSLGANLVSVSPNLRQRLADFASDNPFSFAMLSDEDNRVAQDYGLVFQLADELRPIYEQFGIDLATYDGNERFELPLPATYIIASDDVIAHAFMAADYTRRMEPDDILAVLQGLQS
ncbi:MAG: peroxiredoxin-like family protein [Mariprofundaceae bacterium]